MEREHVVLVDENDNAIAEMPKLTAHQQGQLHRAFSVFIFNDRGELLLQQRARQKYHGGGLWTNTCCSHPQWEEDVRQSAMERLRFEMGLYCDIRFSHSFIYRTEVENNLVEHEYDYVFVGYSNDEPKINPDEVLSYRWMGVNDILDDIHLHPQKYTYWFKTALPLVVQNM